MTIFLIGAFALLAAHLSSTYGKRDQKTYTIAVVAVLGLLVIERMTLEPEPPPQTNLTAYEKALLNPATHAIAYQIVKDKNDANPR